MIKSIEFLNECKKSNYTLFTGTPCSYLKPFINKVIDDSDLDFIETTNEGDAVALASGAWLGGRKSVVMFQNSGLGNAVNPITSLSHTMQIPFIGIVTLRGESGGVSDELQHELMGAITIELLELMEIPWSFFPTESEKVEGAFFFAESICETKKKPFFFVMKKNSVEGYELKNKEFSRTIERHNVKINNLFSESSLVSRTESLQIIKKKFNKQDVLISTTGKTGRELFEIEDSPNHLYMVGSMGCALPLGIGLGYTNFKNKICVIDGDGALLMRLGNMALAGQIGSAQIVHILLDNGVHDSTGGQRSFSENVDFAKIASSCGYQNIYEVDSLEKFELSLDKVLETGGLSFIRFMIKAGSPKNLGRPTVKPYEVALRMKNHIEEINERSH